MVLSYNHCRFFSKFFLNKKRRFASDEFALYSSLKSMRPLFFFCMANYCLSAVYGLTGIAEIFALGYVTQRQTLLLVAALFLTCADVGTIFNRDTNYNLVSILLSQNSRKLVYYLFTCVVLFAGLSVICFELFSSSVNFASVQGAMVTLSCLMFGDSVLDVFDALQEVPALLSAVLTFFIFIFFLNVLQILLAVASVGFQKVQENFTALRHKRTLRLHALRQRNQALDFTKSRFRVSNLEDFEAELGRFMSYESLDSQPQRTRSGGAFVGSRGWKRPDQGRLQQWRQGSGGNEQSLEASARERQLIQSIAQRKGGLTQSSRACASRRARSIPSARILRKSRPAATRRSSPSFW